MLNFLSISNVEEFSLIRRKRKYSTYIINGWGGEIQMAQNKNVKTGATAKSSASKTTSKAGASASNKTSKGGANKSGKR